jgi:hypothetical protein
VTTRGSELERASSTLLAADIGEIEQADGRRQLIKFIERLGLPLAAQV